MGRVHGEDVREIWVSAACVPPLVILRFLSPCNPGGASAPKLRCLHGIRAACRNPERSEGASRTLRQFSPSLQTTGITHAPTLCHSEPFAGAAEKVRGICFSPKPEQEMHRPVASPPHDETCRPCGTRSFYVSPRTHTIKIYGIGLMPLSIS